jgi:hypothetical protein
MNAKSFSERVSICEMSACEIVGLIPEAVLEAIRARDPHPCFVAWEVGRTGFSTGRLGEAGSVKKFWSDTVVQELAEAGNARPAVQIDHSASSSRARRVGEILRGIARRVGEVVRALWIGYIEDRETARAIRRNELPSCSIEGMVDVRESEEMGIEVLGVPAMRALALAGPEATPGFVDAGVLAVVQETSQGQEQNMTETISLGDVRRFIEENGVHADEIFPKESLASLPVIADLVRNEVETALESMDLAKVMEGKGKLAEDARKLRDERDAALRELAELKMAETARKIRAKALAHPLLFGVRKDIAAMATAMLNIDAIAAAEDEKAAIDREVRAAVERAREAGVVVPFDAKSVPAAQADAEDVEIASPGRAKDYTKPENNALIPAAL